jgi:hypothetical protein
MYETFFNFLLRKINSHPGVRNLLLTVRFDYFVFYYFLIKIAQTKKADHKILQDRIFLSSMIFQDQIKFV